MTKIARETAKVLMFFIAWAFPIYIAKENDDNFFLFLFILSSMLTVSIFSHYEDLESKDNNDEQADK